MRCALRDVNLPATIETAKAQATAARACALATKKPDPKALPVLIIALISDIIQKECSSTLGVAVQKNLRSHKMEEFEESWFVFQEVGGERCTRALCARSGPYSVSFPFTCH